MTESRAAHPGARARAPQPMDQAIGASLRLRRRGVGMSQEQLAEGLGISGQQVRKYEAGRNRISASTLIAAARVLRVPAASLLPGDMPHDGHDALGKALGVSGAPELLLAFALIRDARRRAAVLCIAEGLAAPDPSPAESG